jgi:purine-nucleoside phosphorylase
MNVGGACGAHGDQQNIFAREPRAPQADRSSYYSPRLLDFVERVAVAEQIDVRRGTYVAMLGPNYETRAEYRWLQTLGDVVGMSTVPEVVVAREIGLPAIAFSMVTNVFRPDEVQQTSSEAVIAAASSAEPRLRRLVIRLLAAWNNEWPVS